MCDFCFLLFSDRWARENVDVATETNDERRRVQSSHDGSWKGIPIPTIYLIPAVTAVLKKNLHFVRLLVSSGCRIIFVIENGSRYLGARNSFILFSIITVSALTYKISRRAEPGR